MAPQNDALTSASYRIIHNLDLDEYFDRGAIPHTEPGWHDDLSLEAAGLLLAPADDGRAHQRIGSWQGHRVTFATPAELRPEADITEEVIDMLSHCGRTRDTLAIPRTRRNDDS